MGISASNHCIPVFFNKTNGVFFNYHPKSHQCDGSLKQNLATPLFDPCPSLESSFLPKKPQHSKPKCSPNRNIYLGNKNENMCRYKSKISRNEDSCNERMLEKSLQMVCNSDLETDTSVLSHWDQDQDILSTCDSFSFDESAKFQETSSLRANFSPASLQERYLKAESYFLHEKALNNLQVGQLSVENEKSGVFSDSHVLHMKRDASSADSLSNISDHLFVNSKQVTRLFHQDISVDSETSDFSLDLQPQTTDLGYQTVGQLEHLQNQLCEVKKAVQELDKEFVELKIYEMPPKHSWELLVISPSDVDQSSGSENDKNSASDITKQNYEETVSKISNDFLLLKNSDKTRENSKSINLDLNSMPLEFGQCLKKVPVPSLYQPDIETHGNNQTNADCTFIDGTSEMLASEVNTQTKILDSGSDFGNSLESELEIYEIGRSCSLEWDPMCLPECASTLDDCQSFPSPTDTLASLSEFIHDQEIVSPLSESESKDTKDFQIDNNSLKKCYRSHSIPSEICTRGINNLAFRKNLLKRSLTLPNCKNTKIENDSLYQKQTTHSSITSEESLPLKYLCESSLYSSEESGFLDTLNVRKNKMVVKETDVYFASSNIQSDNFKEKTINYLLEDDNGNTCFLTENQSASSIDQMNASINRDSAYCEESFIDNYLIKNIGHKQNLIEYSFLTWKGESLKNKQIRKGYEEIAETFGFESVRVIRKDDYCAIRAALFQVLSRGLPVLNHHGSAELVYQKLQRWIDGSYPWLMEWNFGGKLSYTGNGCMQGFYKCLQVLQNVEEELKRCVRPEDRLTALLNDRPEVDADLMEAVKILMMAEAARSGPAPRGRPRVPASSAPPRFLFDLLNGVGNGAALRRAELPLLGRSLSTALRVVRPDRGGREDFALRYPGGESEEGPEATLIAEDDRTYLIPAG